MLGLARLMNSWDMHQMVLETTISLYVLMCSHASAADDVQDGCIRRHMALLTWRCLLGWSPKGHRLLGWAILDYISWWELGRASNISIKISQPFFGAEMLDRGWTLKHPWSQKMWIYFPCPPHISFCSANDLYWPDIFLSFILLSSFLWWWKCLMSVHADIL